MEICLKKLGAVEEIVEDCGVGSGSNNTFLEAFKK